MKIETSISGAISYGKEKEAGLSRSAKRRQREREQRLQTILAAAESLFASDGYHQTSMESIADRAEVSVGTVYFYFKNKEDLLLQLLEAIGFQLRNLLGTKVKKADNYLNGFRAAGKVFFESFCLKNPGKVAIIFRESAGQGEHVEKRRKEIFDEMIMDVTNALKRIRDNNGIKFQSDMSTEVMATCIMGTFERIAYQYLIWQDRSKDLKKIGKDTVDFIVGGIHNLIKT